ncbi:MAG: serine protease [Bdellovibrionaceae bacterium]|nr:serine protease [Pseudobdellovibrionaceae bacterium]
MKKLLLINSLFLLLSACGRPGQSESDLDFQAEAMPIKGGIDVPSTDPLAPSLVRIINTQPKQEFICTGALIHPRVVLTAAHCLPNSYEGLVVHFGVQPKDFKNLDEGFTVATAIAHEKYNPEIIRDDNPDIALLILDREAPETARIIALDSEDYPLKLVNPTPLRAYGYGVSGNATGFFVRPKRDMGVLRSVDVVSNNFSRKKENFQVDQKNKKGVCSGDSGGPLILQTEMGPVVAGITMSGRKDIVRVFLDYISRGRSDLCEGKTTFKTVAYYRPWIDSKINALFGQ